MHEGLKDLDWEAIGQEAVQLLRELLRFNTTNPPGNERACAEHLAAYLKKAGIESELLCAEPERPNLIARLKGSGELPPLLLNAHLDVVPAEPEHWDADPFAGEIIDGYLIGRGTIDMKNMAAMSAVVMKVLKEQGVPLKRDIIFAAVADEETGCEKGSEWLIENHPEKVQAEYALGELGGFTLYMNGRTLYPIQVAEKGMCWIQATTAGEPGHGSVIREDNAVVRLAEFIAKVGRTRLPLHIASILERSFKDMAMTQPQPARSVLPLVMKERLSGFVTDYLVPDRGVGRVFASLVRNTANPTVLRAGTKTNVVPSRAEVELDGRIALGSSYEELLEELRGIAGPEVQFEVIRTSPPCETTPDTPLFELLKEVVGEHDPGAMAVPYVIPGFTDAKSWTRLGIKCYGFSPVRFEPDADIRFSELYHGHNERIPVDGFKFGLKMLADVVIRFCAGSEGPR